MSLVKEISDKGATTSWSPIKEHASLLAVGTKEASGGSGFDNVGGEISIYSVNYTDYDPNNKSPIHLGNAITPSRFNHLAWGKVNGGPSGYGVLAGGMRSGVVNIWDPKSLTQGSSSEGNVITSVQKHKNKVNCLQFNPHDKAAHLLATGASDSEVYIVDLNTLTSPKVYSPAGPNSQAKHTADVSAVAWNSQVVHILASAALNGQCTVWDMRQNSPWCEIRESKGAGFSAICWNPNQGLHLLTATDDDSRPVIRLWDLRSSTTNPLAEFSGHTAGVFSVSWCPHDPMLLMSCAKDNRTILWDLLSGQPIHDLNESKDSEAPAASGLQGLNQGMSGLGIGGMNAAMAQNAFGANSASSAANMFGSQRSQGLGAGGSGRRYEVQWAPHIRGMLSTCSFDRKVQVFSMNGAGSGKNTSGIPRRAPTWVPKKSGVSFGFGGKLVSWGIVNGNSRTVTLSTVVDAPELVHNASNFDHALMNALQQDNEMTMQRQQLEQQTGVVPDNNEEPNDHVHLMKLCQQKSQDSTSQFDKDVWSFMTVLFEPAARDKILQELGYDVDQIAQQIAKEVPLPKKSPQDDTFEISTNQTPVQDNTNILDDPNNININSGPATGLGVLSNGGFGGLNTGGFGGLNNGSLGDASDVFGGGAPGDAFDAPPPRVTENEPAAGASVSTDVNASTPTELSPAKSAEEPIVDDTEVDLSIPGIIVERPNPKADEMVKKALLLGNFDAAVQCCLKHNRLADALLLATCGGESLWNTTLDAYLERQMKSKPYMPLLSAIIRTELDQLVENSELTDGKWKEVLAIISQYGKSEEVPGLCEMLADRLEQELGEGGLIAATLCYMCAINVEKTVGIWIKQTMNTSGSITDKLQKIMEKISVFRYGVQDPDAILKFPAVMKQYIAYSQALAQQGQLDYAASYIAAIGIDQIDPNDPQYSGVDVEEYERLKFDALVLKDRIFGAHVSPEQSISQYIPQKWFPFEIQYINEAPPEPEPAAYQQQQQQPSYQQSPQLQPQTYGQPQPQPQNNYGQQTPMYGQQQQQNGIPSYNAAPQPTMAPTYQPPTTTMPKPAGVTSAPHQYSQLNGTPNQQSNMYGQNNPVPVPVPGPPGPALTANQPPMIRQTTLEPPTAPGTVPPSQPQPVRTSNPIPVNDGFGTTAGNPMAGQKYGNMTAANNRLMGDPSFGQPAGPVPTPGVNIMNPAVSQPPAQSEPAPAPAPAPVKREMPPGMQPVMDSLRQLISLMSSLQLSQLDTKQLKEGEKSVATLNEKLMTGKIPETLQQDLKALSDATLQYDFTKASQIRLNMTRTSWADQKDWLKGFSHLIALAVKKYPPQ